jgi:hypothetical protein
MWNVCLLCGDLCAHDDRNKKMGHKAELQRTGEVIEKACMRQGYDECAQDVKGRLEFCNDFIAVEAVYHNMCNLGFTRGLPKTVELAKQGRSVNEAAELAFVKLCREPDKSCD